MRHVVDDARHVLVLTGDPALDPLERAPVELLSTRGHPVAALDRAHGDDPTVDAVVALDAGRFAEDGGERLPRVVLFQFLFDDVGRLAGDRGLLRGDLADDPDGESGAGDGIRSEMTSSPSARATSRTSSL